MKRYLVQTFGCQMNAHDSLRIEEALVQDGWEATDEPALADLVVVNTCSIREKAEHKLMSLLGRLRPWKESRPGAVLAVAGCVAQQEGEQLLRRARHVDVVLGPDNVPELAELVEAARAGAPPVARTVFDLDDTRFLAARPKATSHAATAYVTVMKGCDERCTYCVVPNTRGPERYRPADEIVAEVATVVRAGVREVTLLGQTVNSWHPPDAPDRDEPPRADAELPTRFASTSRFAELLRRIARDVPELARLRYTSPHPRHVTPELVRAHAELDVLASHVHLPVQSGSNRVLKRMLRRYTRELYLDRLHALASAKPGVTFSTDVIVGFPGETDADFEETLSLVREAGFVAAFGFKYSPRPHTPSLRLDDDVPEDEKDVRLARFFDAVAVQQRAHLGSLVGRRVRVLVEGPSRGEGTRFTGRSERNEIVHLLAPPGRNPTAELVDAIVDRANDHSLLAAMEGATSTERVHLQVTGSPA